MIAGLTLVFVLLQIADPQSDDSETQSDIVVGLTGSAHDFSAEEWTGGDLCLACHAPRSELPEKAPLWNPSADFNRTFGDAIQDRGADHRSLPGSGTMVCMRCHDGTVAQDMFGGLGPPRSPNVRHPALMTTGHGGSNHPVGIAYPQLDPEYRPLSAVLSEGSVVLPDGRVECISCHDPHNLMGMPDMLVKSNQRSALCLTCHKK